MRFQTTLLFVLASGLAYAQTQVKTFFQQLPTLKTAPSGQDLLQATDQIASLSAGDVADLLPVIFADLKYDGYVATYAAQALFNVASRPDSGNLLRPHFQEVAALLNRSDPSLVGTGNLVLANLKPPPPEAVPLLAAFVLGPTGTPQAKVDSLGVMLNLLPSVTPQCEELALHVLNLPLGPGARHHALITAARVGMSSAKVAGRVVQDLTDSAETVQIGAIQSLAMMGRNVVMAHASDLARITQNPSSTPTARRLAQDVLDDKDLRCTTLQGAPIQPCK